MAKLVIVMGDDVKGTDRHNVSGKATPPPPGAVYTGIGSYKYAGAMTDGLSTFVTVDGKAIALVTSKSSLNPGETAPGGGHVGQAGTDFVPPAPAPILDPTLLITDPIGTGIPNAGAGSGLLTIGGVKVLLDGDKIDTCDGTGHTANSTVTAAGQSFVSCSE
jgi:hypothetical protein